MAKSKRSSKWIMTGVVGIMVVAMGGFGLSGLVNNSASTAAISVGETDIDINEYNRSYQNAVASVSQQQQRQLSSSEARLMGVPNQVTLRMVQLGAISETARLSGLEISDSKVASLIAEIPAFQDANGKVDPARYKNYLSTNRISEKDFVKSMRSDAERNLVMAALAQLTPSFDGLKADISTRFGEARSAVYLTYKFEDIGVTLTDPTDIEIETFYQTNITNYHGEPDREVRVAYLVPETSAISDSELKTIYDNDIARFTSPATIPQYYMLSFANAEDAQKVTDLDGMKALAKERGLSEDDYLFKDEAVKNLPSELGTQILAKGEGFYGPIEGALGLSVYYVTGVNPEKTQSFEEVKITIAEGLAYDAMNEKFFPVQNNVLDLIAGGVEPEEIAKEADMTFATFNSSAGDIPGLTDDAAFNEEVLNAGIDEERDLISLTNGGVAVLRVMKETEAAPLPLADIKERVKADLVTEQKTAALDKFHGALMAKVEAGETLETLATEFNLNISTTPALPQHASISQMPLPIAFELFGKTIGEIWDITDQDNNYLVRADKSVPFDAADPKNADFLTQNNSQVSAQVSDQFITDYTSNMATVLKATVNSSLVEQVVGAAEQ